MHVDWNDVVGRLGARIGELEVELAVLRAAVDKYPVPEPPVESGTEDED